MGTTDGTDTIVGIVGTDGIATIPIMCIIIMVDTIHTLTEVVITDIIIHTIITTIMPTALHLIGVEMDTQVPISKMEMSKQ